jgi:hypothetical protein
VPAAERGRLNCYPDLQCHILKKRVRIPQNGGPVPETRRRGWLDSDSVLNSPGTVLPFVELTPGAYRWEQTVKSWLRRFGYYSLFPSGALR